MLHSVLGRHVGYWSFGWDKNHSFSINALQKLCIVSWCSILSKPLQTLCAWSESAVMRSQLKTAILNAALWFTVTWANLFSGVCISVACCPCSSVILSSAFQVSKQYLYSCDFLLNSSFITLSIFKWVRYVIRVPLSAKQGKYWEKACDV